MDTNVESVRFRSFDMLPSVLPIVTLVALTAYLYKGTFDWWWWEWTYPGSFYAHALFVPFFVAAMIWRDREKLAAAPYDPSWLGLAFLVPAVLLLLLGRKADVTVVESISFMLFILGACTMVVGKTRTRLLLFPLLFIMLMMPLVPDQLINSIAFPIQLASAKLATGLLNLLTLHSERVGTLIKMDSYKLAVELPCSGFKTLVSLLTFTAAFAYLTDAARWKRWTLFLTTIPLSLVINALRITFIGIVGELISAKAALTFHDYSGFIVLVMAFTFLYTFARILRCDSFLGIPFDDPADDPNRPAQTGTAADSSSDSGKASTPPKPIADVLHDAMAATGDLAGAAARRLRGALPLSIGLNLIVLGAIGAHALAFRPIVPAAPIARSQVPTEFEAPGAQSGSPVTYRAVTDANNDKLSREVQETLNPSRVISRVYRGSDGSTIELFITAGNGRKVFHDPHTCMLGGDAVLNDIGEIDIPSAAGPVRVLETRFRTASQPDETEMLICYVVDGKMVPRTEDVRNHIILQTLFGDGGKPSYWMRVTQRTAGTDRDRSRRQSPRRTRRQTRTHQHPGSRHTIK
jgi:exosortase